jgi:hypothetical protein
MWIGCAEEAVKHASDELCRDSWTAIAYGENEVIPFQTYRHIDRLADRRVTNGVADQVGHHESQ